MTDQALEAPTARQPLESTKLDAEIARLPDLGIEELRTRWKALFGRPAPKSFRRNLLIRGVAYQMQVQVYGGLSDKTKRRLREIASAERNGDPDAVLAGPQIKPGTRRLEEMREGGKSARDASCSRLVLES